MAEVFFGLLCSNVVVLPRLYQQFCDLVPSTSKSRLHVGSEEAANESARQHSHGGSKHEWLQSERAGKQQKEYRAGARLEDEEAINIALDEAGVKG